jgi:hypothetical protein
MNRLILESGKISTLTEPAAHQSTRVIIDFDSNTLIESKDMESLILSLSPTKELLEKILRELHEDAA